MMKIFIGLFCVFLSGSCYAAENQCSVIENTSIEFRDWIDLNEMSNCFNKSVAQTHMEIDASYTYLNIGAHFARDVINRPGVADFFFKAAKEEREHAMKLIEYLSMRGHLNKVEFLMTKKENDDKNKDTFEKPPTFENAAEAFSYALKLEGNVTVSIRNLIKSCENAKIFDNSNPPKLVKLDKNYYHIVDWLTGVYLEEQLHGKRDLAGKLSQLKKMGPGELGEFLFDKTL